MEQHRQPEEEAPHDAPHEHPQPTEADDSAAHTEQDRRRALFEHSVALGINPEDATAAVEVGDYLDAARRQLASAAVQHNAGDEALEPSEGDGETAPASPRVYVTTDSTGLAASDEPDGAWLDAAVEADDLEHAALPFLRHGDDGRLSYRITGTSGFAGYTIEPGTPLDTVARVARGIAEHGRAFVAYLDTWGSDQEAVDAFSRYFVGSYPSIAAWAETEVEAYGWWDVLNEHVPPPLLACLRIDFERLGRELSYDAHVVEDEAAGQVHVFRLQA